MPRSEWQSLPERELRNRVAEVEGHAPRLTGWSAPSTDLHDSLKALQVASQIVECCDGYSLPLHRLAFALNLYYFVSCPEILGMEKS
jgi:hypothetical protein